MILQKLPNLAIKFEELRLILDLRTRANPHTMLGQAIRNAIEAKKTPTREILQYVQDQARDSFKTMADCIGTELTQRILKHKTINLK